MGIILYTIKNPATFSAFLLNVGSFSISIFDLVLSLRASVTAAYTIFTASNT